MNITYYTCLKYYILYACFIQLLITSFLLSKSQRECHHYRPWMQNTCIPSYSRIFQSSMDDYEVDWDSMPDFQANIPATKRKAEPVKKETASGSSGPAMKPPKKPNSDWRAAMLKPSRESFISSVTKGKGSSEPISAQRSAAAPIRDLRSTEVKRPITRDNMDIDISDDFDYEDFESAMLEEESMYGSGSTVGVKRSIEIVSSTTSSDFYDMPGLETGDIISKVQWSLLTDSNEKAYDVGRLEQLAGYNDIMIIYADPRRMNDDFRSVLGNNNIDTLVIISSLTLSIEIDELKKLPFQAMKASMVAINCADATDNRKFQKKSSITIPMLIDPTKKVSFL
jgi:hypothetical protein